MSERAHTVFWVGIVSQNRFEQYEANNLYDLSGEMNRELMFGMKGFALAYSKSKLL